MTLTCSVCGKPREFDEVLAKFAKTSPWFVCVACYKKIQPYKAKNVLSPPIRRKTP